jgi:hypothetical protein
MMKQISSWRLFMKNKQQILDALRRELPPVFTRKLASRLTGGYLSVGGFANLDCRNEGPGGVRVKKTILYEKEAFLEWLERRIGG